MNGSAISRRLMAALFAVMVVPVLGWSVIVDLAEHVLSSSRSPSPPAASELESVIVQARERLVLVLGISLATLAGALLYLRRVLVTPLESLAERARKVAAGWTTPPECERSDEIGDLARALDAGVRQLSERAEGARRFAADLSHELRTPLAAVQGAAELLEQEALSSTDVQRFHSNILQESRRLGRLVEGILELERGAGFSRRTEESCELRESIGRVVEGLSVLASRKEVRVEAALPERPVFAAVDADRHDRVLFALLENALKFSPAGAAITITLESRDAGHRVTVSDHGPGVALGERVTIFERYAHTRTKANPRGSGLGLAIAKALVESWGGVIGISDRRDGGACFFYDMPTT